jgi:hypothetical protein
VPLIRDIDGALESMRTGAARAAEIATGADNGAEEVAARMVASGLIGIARAMVQIRTGIGEVRARIRGVARATGEARAPVEPPRRGRLRNR